MSTAKQVLCVLGQEMEQLVTVLLHGLVLLAYVARDPISERTGEEGTRGKTLPQEHGDR